MLIKDFLQLEAVVPELGGSTPEQVLTEVCRPLAVRTGFTVERLLEPLLARERLGSTGIGDGVALPHAKVEGVPVLAAAFGRSRQGIDFGSIDSRPATFFFALVAPANGHGAHLNALARISRVFKSAAFREALLAAEGAAELYRLITDEDGK